MPVPASMTPGSAVGPGRGQSAARTHPFVLDLRIRHGQGIHAYVAASRGGVLLACCFDLEVACPWRIRKSRRDRHLEQAVVMFPPSVTSKDGRGGANSAPGPRKHMTAAATRSLCDTCA